MFNFHRLVKFNPKQLGKLDENIGTVLRVDPPYSLLKENKKPSGARKKVIWFGFGNHQKVLKDINVSAFVKIYNDCLDFVRRECADCDLYYKPHPVETDEYKSFRLDGFKIIRDQGLGELFLYKNWNQVKYVFSVSSTISRAAYGMGFNAYIFFKLFRSAYSGRVVSGYENFFAGMPTSFYISNLNEKLKENAPELKRDVVLEEHLREVLVNHPGKTWFVVADPALLLMTMAVANLIRILSPTRPIELLLPYHERWNLINKEEIRTYFDRITDFPILQNSLRPQNLPGFFKGILATVLKIGKLDIGSGDVLIGVGPGSLVENYLISHFLNYSIALTTQEVFDNCHKFETPLDLTDFEIKPAALIFNKIIDPLLGLHRTFRRLRRPSGRNGLIFSRYQQPVNEIFDAVYVLKFFDEKKF